MARESAPVTELERFRITPGARVLLCCKAGAEPAQFGLDNIAVCQLVQQLNGSGHRIRTKQCVCHIPEPPPARNWRAVVG